MDSDDKKLCVLQWVAQFEKIPTRVLMHLAKVESEKWHELTLPVYGDAVRVKATGEVGKVLWVVENMRGDLVYKVNFDGMLLEFRHAFQTTDQFIRNEQNFKTRDFTVDELEVFHASSLPAQSTMWAFSDMSDIEWLKTEDALREMSEWYFRIYKHDDIGYFFGIDHLFSDMYIDYWEPLYDSRGLNRCVADDDDEDDE